MKHPPVSVMAAPRLLGGLAALLLALCAASLVGIWPTWRLFGPRGLLSASWAACANLIVFPANLAGTWLVGRRLGAVAAGKFFLFISPVRIVIVLAVAASIASLASVEDTVFWLWVGGFYLVLVLAEAVWLAGAGAGRQGSSERRDS